MFLLKHICGLDYRVDGLEHLPAGAAVILAKHQSAWETIAFQQIFPPQTGVLKRELLWIPLFGWALALLRPIAIDRGAGRVAIEQVIEQGRERLQSGIWVVVFPEGTRVASGTRRRYGIGGAALAAASGYPVVPVAHNAGFFWPRRGFLKRPGTIRVVIGPVIDPRGKTAEEIRRQAEEWIENTMARLEGKQPD
jgi:1-acyl-sn-glycerol-3-phosphate acyltransferase